MERRVTSEKLSRLQLEPGKVVEVDEEEKRRPASRVWISNRRAVNH